MCNHVSNFFVGVDNVCDYIPLVSTGSNLIDLAQKAIVIPFMSQESINSGHYYTHLDQKSALRSVVLLVPMIGNIIVSIYDFTNYIFATAPQSDTASKARKEVVEEAATQDAAVIEARKEVVDGDAPQDGAVIEADDEVVDGDAQEAVDAVEWVAEEVVDASEVGNKEWDSLQGIKENHLAFNDVTKELRENEDFIRAAIVENPQVFSLLSGELQNNKELALPAIRKDYRLFVYLVGEGDLEYDEDVVAAAQERNTV